MNGFLREDSKENNTERKIGDDEQGTTHWRCTSYNERELVTLLDCWEIIKSHVYIEYSISEIYALFVS